jgi:hypothetical protein
MSYIDTSDAKQVQSAIKKAKTKDEVREEGLRQLLASAQGRAWMWGLLSDCDPYRTPFNTDPIQMGFNCGESNVGLKLIAEIHRVAPESYLMMMKENSNG